MILYLDCASGASGDMLAAALLAATSGDAGPASLLDAVVRPALAAVGVDPAVVSLRAVRRGGFAAFAFDVAAGPGFATMGELMSAVRAAGLPAALTAHVVAVAEAMAAAERAVHGVDEAHLHELAGLDTVVDLVSVAALLHHAGFTTIAASPPALGSGSVTTAHGLLSVPVPAVVFLLRGLPTAGGADLATGVNAEHSHGRHHHAASPVAEPTAVGELTTPTGAALLAHFVNRFGALPAGAVVAYGCGAGGREVPGRANLLRAFIIDEKPLVGASAAASAALADEVDLGELIVLESNIDDASAEVLAHAADELRRAGAVDVWLTAALMKKGRAGTVVHALVRAADRDRLAAVIMRETTTFGVRVLPVGRLQAEERRAAVAFAGETGGDLSGDAREVAVRLGYIGGELVTVSPEFEDCRRLAEHSAWSLKRIYEDVQAAAWRRFSGA
jgi:uncharacterized protein (DUF111 family)